MNLMPDMSNPYNPGDCPEKYRANRSLSGNLSASRETLKLRLEGLRTRFVTQSRLSHTALTQAENHPSRTRRHSQSEVFAWILRGESPGSVVWGFRFSFACSYCLPFVILSVRGSTGVQGPPKRWGAPPLKTNAPRVPKYHVLEASLPVPDVTEDNLEHDAPPQEPQQPGAVTAPQELDGQQPEVASPLQEPPGEQAEAAGTTRISFLPCCTVRDVLLFLRCKLAAHLSCPHQPLVAVPFPPILFAAAGFSCTETAFLGCVTKKRQMNKGGEEVSLKCSMQRDLSRKVVPVTGGHLYQMLILYILFNHIGGEASGKEELIKHDEQEQKEAVTAATAKESAKEKKAEDDQERKLVEVSDDLGRKEEETEEGEEESEQTEKPLNTSSGVPVVSDIVNGELKTSSEVLPVGEKLESTEKCEIDDRTEISSEERPEAGSLAIEISSEQLKKSEGREGNKRAPLEKETFDEETEEAELKISPTVEDITRGEALDTTTGKKESKEHETKLTLGAPGLKSFSTSECSVDTEDDQQSIKPTDEGLQGKTRIVMTDTIKPDEMTTEITPEEAAGKRPPEGITNEAELLSSQEKNKLQGSPFKKLFTGTGLKKLSGKKRKGKREESKLGEQGEPIQHLPASPDSPEEQKGESSASSPEETKEIPSLEKPVDGMQVTENEDAAVSDVARKRESVTPWASFKKMATPKKRVRRPSESDKEEEIDKTKSVAVSATENTIDDNQGELKEKGMDQKPEKTTEKPKKKAGTSVSWEAFLCGGSSKKRARKSSSSSSDEETEHKLGQESQKIEESGQNKEMATGAVLTSSQESDQGQGNSSPEQAGSPSEGEAISTRKSFKRLATLRRRSKTRMEERTEDSVVGSSLEHSTSHGEPGKEESWVPFRKQARITPPRFDPRVAVDAA
ncbi:uncharacterized protein LOC141921613 [Strix aluco]|uniref:uncharacterized protein LOC141921613 n=1 Tax=Strix aluco TaxID=111821 RepID=UPI003DA2ABA1